MKDFLWIVSSIYLPSGDKRSPEMNDWIFALIWFTWRETRVYPNERSSTSDPRNDTFLYCRHWQACARACARNAVYGASAEGNKFLAHVLRRGVYLWNIKGLFAVGPAANVGAVFMFAIPSGGKYCRSSRSPPCKPTRRKWRWATIVTTY